MSTSLYAVDLKIIGKYLKNNCSRCVITNYSFDLFLELINWKRNLTEQQHVTVCKTRSPKHE